MQNIDLLHELGSISIVGSTCVNVIFVCECCFSRLTTAQNADEFYTLMGDLTQDMLDGKIIDEDVLIEVIYTTLFAKWQQYKNNKQLNKT